MKIKGTTKIIGLFGYPVEHTASPLIHNAAFQALELDYAYLPFEVKPEYLETALRALTALNVAGINVTIPHKETVLPYLQEVSPEAKAIGAVNTILVKSGRLIGYNTDGPGFIASLKEEKQEVLKGKTFLILGAGGAARAVATQVAQEDAGAIFLTDKLPGKAKAVVTQLKKYLPRAQAQALPLEAVEEKMKAVDFLINATPLGMKESDPLVINPEWLSSDTFVYDLVYRPTPTALIKAARDKGCRTAVGLDLLLHQAMLSFKLWTDQTPSLEVMRQALEENFK